MVVATQLEIRIVPCDGWCGMKTPAPLIPPTITRLKVTGVDGVCVLCRDCRRSEPVPFDVVALTDETLFPNISKLRRFRCEGCGSTNAVVTPDWRGMTAPGAGG